MLTPLPDYVAATLHLADVRDLAPAVARCRRLLDLDADPVAVDGMLGDDPALRRSVLAEPGVRVPRAVDGFEIAVRAIVGQQISVAGAITVLGRIVRAGATEEARREAAFAESEASVGDTAVAEDGPVPAKTRRRDARAARSCRSRRRASSPSCRTASSPCPAGARPRSRPWPPPSPPATWSSTPESTAPRPRQLLRDDPRHRRVDRQLRRDARARRSGRVPPERPGRAPRGRPRSAFRPPPWRSTHMPSAGRRGAPTR